VSVPGNGLPNVGRVVDLGARKIKLVDGEPTTRMIVVKTNLPATVVNSDCANYIEDLTRRLDAIRQAGLPELEFTIMLFDPDEDEPLMEAGYRPQEPT
jgi:hypothetical protein